MLDCLFVGFNEMSFDKYEETIRTMGTKSGAYRDLNLNFFRYNNKLHTVSDAFNMFCYPDEIDKTKRISLGNIFSLTIAYLGSYLAKRGFSIDYINYFQEEKDKLAEKLINNNIRLIAISTTFYITVFPILEIISFVRKYNNTAKIVLGGPFIVTQAHTQDEETLQYTLKTIDADFIVNSSQGEYTLSRLLDALKNDLPVQGIENLFYREGEQFIATPVLREDNALDENIIDWSLYEDDIGSLLNLRTSISCPFSCKFCGFPQHAGKFKVSSVETVEKELNAVAQLGKVTSIHFIDDTFNIPPERFKQIMRMMIRNKYPFKWNCYFRCQYADREMVQLMKESGCEGVFLGFESGSQKILNNMNKAVTVDKYCEGLALLKEYDIITFGSFIIGFPGETEETARETIDFIEENQPTFFRAQLWYCNPFTPIWQERDKYQLTNSQFEWSHKTMNAATACDIIEDIFLNVKNSTWIQQYNFASESIFNLIQRGMSLGQIKAMMNAFNEAIREKLRYPGGREVSSDILMRLKSACEGKYRDLNIESSMKCIDKKYQADFDF